ncbi:MAG: hypothetical protein AB1420_13385 [Bacillota bacterium]
MLGKQEERFVMEKAYVPEHMPDYLRHFSGMEPFLEGHYLYYLKDDRLSFIGYPLDEDFCPKRLSAAVSKLSAKVKPRELRIMAPKIPEVIGYIPAGETENDMYSLLNISPGIIRVPSKVKNMLNRAGRELETSITQSFTMEHQRLLLKFLREKSFDEQTTNFFHLIPDYLAYSSSAYIIDARCRARGELKAYNIAAVSEGSFAFYLFNITGDRENYVPGTSDLLLNELIKLAGEQGKRYINLGLRINQGIQKFKAKWGAGDFHPYTFASFRIRGRFFDSFFRF